MSRTKTIEPIFYVSGYLLICIGLAMSIPGLYDLVTDGGNGTTFITGAATTIFFGMALILGNRGCSWKLNLKAGYLLTSLAWVAISLVSALPFWLSNYDISFADSVFEAVSGLTTTGATVLTNLDHLDKGLLLWRATLQWIGGIGIIVMAIAILPFLGIGGMQLYRTESSCQSDKEAPRAVTISVQVILVYLLLTSMCFIAYATLGMTPFEAVVHAFTTISTGGFSTSDGSIGHFKSYPIDWVAIVFMLAASLPFVLYIGSYRQSSLWVLLRDSQVKAFLTMVMVLIAVMATWLALSQHEPFVQALTETTFAITSIISTTGYAMNNYLAWGGVAAIFFFLLTFIGGCSGSTGGGIKIFRIVVLLKDISKQLSLMLYPHGVFFSRMNGKTIEENVTQSVAAFFAALCFSFGLLTVVLTIFGVDFTTAMSGAATALANVGPGVGDIIGPAGNFSTLPSGAKWALDVGMILGRLEYLTILVVFHPSFWAR